MILPGTAALRRRLALGFVALGAVLASRSLSHDLPSEQTLVFRLRDSARHAPLKLSASLVRVGQREPSAGLTIARDGTESGDPREKLRLPNGDYVVTVEWEQKHEANAKESETSLVERVTLSGGETIVPLEKRVPE